MENQQANTRPGYKTTEFWLSALGLVAGLIVTSGLPDDNPIVKAAGMVLSGLSVFGYAQARGKTKALVAFLILPLALFLAGCCRGHVRADAIAPAVELVSDRHDKMLRGQLDPRDLNGDGQVNADDENDRQTYLRTTDMLRRTLQTARE